MLKFHPRQCEDDPGSGSIHIQSPGISLSGPPSLDAHLLPPGGGESRCGSHVRSTSPSSWENGKGGLEVAMHGEVDGVGRRLGACRLGFGNLFQTCAAPATLSRLMHVHEVQGR